MENIVNIANIYINLGYWLSHFKASLFIIIPKSNKITYNSFKSFYSIVLLNTLSKLIEKVISEHLQFYSIANNLIYPNQLKGLKQCSITDVSIFLTYLIQSGWVKSLQMSTLAFNITQFFPSLNHQLIPLILKKAGFDSRIFILFSDYLVDRKTKYLQNSFTSSFFTVDIGVG